MCSSTPPKKVLILSCDMTFAHDYGRKHKIKYRLPKCLHSQVNITHQRYSAECMHAGVKVHVIYMPDMLCLSFCPCRSVPLSTCLCLFCLCLFIFFLLSVCLSVCMCLPSCPCQYVCLCLSLSASVRQTDRHWYRQN